MNSFINKLKGNTLIAEAFSIHGKALKTSNVTFSDILLALYAKYGTAIFTKAQVAKDLTGFSEEELHNAINKMFPEGYIEKSSAGKYIIGQQGIDFVTASGVTDLKNAEEEIFGTDDLEGLEVDNGGEKAKGIKDITKLVQKKFVVPKVGNNSKYRDQVKTILDHMISTSEGLTITTYLLAGDVGSGKTSFISSISVLTGVPLVIIEAPHITQEHIINIPFLVIDGNKKRTGNISIDDTAGDFKVVQAESNLVSQLRNHHQQSREEIEGFINKNPQIKETYESVGIYRRLMELDGMYNSILFLDEYFRTSSVQIRNVLRNILNGKIGNDKIPEGVYICMASNVTDSGVDEIPENYEFQMMNFETPTKEDLFSYLKGKYVDDSEEGTTDTPSGLKVKPEVFNTFYEALDDDSFGINDEVADVRLSPRRLEQMLIYIDAMTPCKTEADVSGLLSYVKINLTNYLTGDTFNKLPLFLDTVKDIIKKTSPELASKVDKIKPFGKSDWKEILSEQIEAKLKLGENRKYIPIAAGDPGIGKCLSADTLLNLSVSEEMYEYLTTN